MSKVKSKLSCRLVATVLSILLVMGMVPMSVLTTLAKTDEHPNAVTITVKDGENPVKGATVLFTVYSAKEKAGYGEEKTEITDEYGVVEILPSTDFEEGDFTVSAKVLKAGYKSSELKDEESKPLAIESAEQNFDVTIDSMGVTVQKNENLVYNGEEQALVTITGIKKDDIVSYRINDEEPVEQTVEDGIESLEIKKTDAGEYDVKVSVERAGFAKMEEKFEKIAINKAEIEGIEIESAKPEYDGTNKDLVVVKNIPETDTVKWYVDGVLDENVPAGNVPQRMAYGKYSVKLVVSRDDNYKLFSKSVDVSIELTVADEENLKFYANDSLVYNNEDLKAITVEKQDGYSLEYSFDGETGWTSFTNTENYPTVKNAGEYIIYVKATNNASGNEETYPISVKVAKAKQDLVFENKDLPEGCTIEGAVPYEGKSYDFKAIDEKGLASGEITYKLQLSNDGIATINNDGELTVGYPGKIVVSATLSGNDNYNEKTIEHTLIVKGKKGNDDHYICFDSDSIDYTLGTSDVVSEKVATKKDEKIEGNIYYFINTDYGVKINEFSGKITVTNYFRLAEYIESGGKIKVTAKKEKSDYYGEDTVSYEVNIKFADTPENPISLFVPDSSEESGKKQVDKPNGENDWYKDNVTVKPVEEYVISKKPEDNNSDFDFKNDVCFSDQGEKTRFVYLRNGDGGITKPIDTGINKIDTDAPDAENMKIEFSELNFIKKIGEKLGFYKSKVEITFSAKDEISQIDHFNWYYVKCDDCEAKWVLSDDDGVIANEKIKYDEEKQKYYATLTLPVEKYQQLKGKISFDATDKAGNTSIIKSEDDYIFVVDPVSPKMKVTYSFGKNEPKHYNEYPDNFYCKENGMMTITVDDGNFDKEKVMVYLSENGGEFKLIDDIVWQKDLESNGIYVSEYSLNKDGNYKFAITYDYLIYKVAVSEDSEYTTDTEDTDYDYISNTIVIDTTAPVISIDYNGDEEANIKEYLTDHDRVYYDELDSTREEGVNRVATITVDELNFGGENQGGVVITAEDISGEDISGKDVSGKDVSGEDVTKVFNESNWKYENGKYKKTVTYTGDANYTLGISYTDLAGNDPIYEKTSGEKIPKFEDYPASYRNFTIDRVNPTVTDITYSRSVIDKFLETVTFGFYKAKAVVTVTAKDTIAGVNKFDYSYITAEGVSSVNTSLLDQEITYPDKDKKEETIVTFEIPKDALGDKNQFNGNVKVKATDRSGNKSDEVLDTKRIVVDNIAPKSTVTYNDPVQNANNVSYYAGNIDAKIVIDEANFYSEDVNINVTKDGAKYPVSVSWVNNSVDIHTGTFTLTEDGDYVVNIEYTDKSGNKMTSYLSNQLTIDTKDPVITVTNVKHESANNGQTIGITVSVSDKNIPLENFNPTLKAVVKKEGNGNKGTYETVNVNLGSASTSSGANGETVYSYTVANIDTDGFYSVSATAVDYAKHTVSLIEADTESGRGARVETMNFSVNREGSVFWIETEHNDKYSGNKYTDKLNGTYANDQVTVKLHEVNVDKVDENADKKTVFTLNDGTSAKGIALKERTGDSGNYDKNVIIGSGGWYESIYTLDNKNFDHDGVYSLNIVTYDKANNSNVNTKTEAGIINFTLDRTKPVISANIKDDQRINNSEHQVEFGITETNLDEKTVVVKLTDNSGKKIETNVENIGNNEYKFRVGSGYNYTVQIVAKDLAGNESELFKVKHLTVTTNIIILWYANTPLFWGSIAGVLVIAAAIILLIYKKKKRG